MNKIYWANHRTRAEIWWLLLGLPASTQDLKPWSQLCCHRHHHTTDPRAVARVNQLASTTNEVRTGTPTARRTPRRTPSTSAQRACGVPPACLASHLRRTPCATRSTSGPASGRACGPHAATRRRREHARTTRAHPNARVRRLPARTHAASDTLPHTAHHLVKTRKRAGCARAPGGVGDCRGWGARPPALNAASRTHLSSRARTHTQGRSMILHTPLASR